ncbi:MAG: hypothetical protein DRJ51_06010, partial [Thermoprotei archaeon]
MLVASYHDFGVKAARKAVEVLLKGGSALDAVEMGIREIEGDPNVRSVGLNGYPNWLGEVELDAGIMDGKTLKACGVAAVKYVKYPITLARRLLEESPHVLIVGEGALKLAKALGVELASTTSSKHSQEAKAKKEELLRAIEKGELTGYRKEVYMKIYRLMTKVSHETIGVIAVDSWNNIVAGTSTSGLAFKVPGRVGDSAVVGAGFYADNKYGAAICTGVGEVALRTLAAFHAVRLLAENYTPQEVAEIVIERALAIAEQE